MHVPHRRLVPTPVSGGRKDSVCLETRSIARAVFFRRNVKGVPANHVTMSQNWVSLKDIP